MVEYQVPWPGPLADRFKLNGDGEKVLAALTRARAAVLGHPEGRKLWDAYVRAEMAFVEAGRRGIGNVGKMETANKAMQALLDFVVTVREVKDLMQVTAGKT
jgi:hypothetical protein